MNENEILCLIAAKELKEKAKNNKFQYECNLNVHILKSYSKGLYPRISRAKYGNIPNLPPKFNEYYIFD